MPPVCIYCALAVFCMFIVSFDLKEEKLMSTGPAVLARVSGLQPGRVLGHRLRLRPRYQHHHYYYSHNVRIDYNVHWAPDHHRRPDHRSICSTVSVRVHCVNARWARRLVGPFLE